MGKSKTKAEHTPEEWAEHLKKAREYRNRPENTERLRNTAKASRDRNKKPFTEAQKEKQREWRIKNKDQRRESARIRYLETREAVLARSRIRGLEKRSHMPVGIFETLLALQGNACAVCLRPFDKTNRNLKPHADHCHDSKMPRGLLCNHCNLIEGWIKKTGVDGVEFGARLAAYLANPPAKIAELV